MASDSGGESGSRGESVTAADVDAARRKVLIMWLRDLGYEGSADDLEAADETSVLQIAYDIADDVETDTGTPAEVAGPLVWHLRDWARQHEKLTRGG